MSLAACSYPSMVVILRRKLNYHLTYDLFMTYIVETSHFKIQNTVHFSIIQLEAKFIFELFHYFIQGNRFFLVVWSVMALSMSMRLGKVRTAFVVSLLMAVQWFMFIETKVKRLIHTTKINI